MEKSINSALKKAKRKQLLKITLISAIIVLIMLPVFWYTGNYFASRNSTKLFAELDLYHAVAAPNIQIDSQVLRDSTMFGGNIVTNRSKNINGYLVPWSTLTNSYNWFTYEIDINEIIPRYHKAKNAQYEYDKQTKNKVATFYHPLNKNYFDGVINELEEISQMENYVAEVAISFDKPYRFSEIEKQIPQNLNIVWIYVTSQIADENNGPLGLPVYGFQLHDPAEIEPAYKSFVESLEKYNKHGDIEAINEFFKENKDKPFKEVEILGVMLTGRTENFRALIGKDFIRGASVGATAPIVPYIAPDKWNTSKNKKTDDWRNHPFFIYVSFCRFFRFLNIP